MCTEVSGPASASWTPAGASQSLCDTGGGGGRGGLLPGPWPPLHGPGGPVHQPIRPRGPEGDRILEDGE